MLETGDNGRIFGLQIKIGQLRDDVNMEKKPTLVVVIGMDSVGGDKVDSAAGVYDWMVWVEKP